MRLVVLGAERLGSAVEQLEQLGPELRGHVLVDDALAALRPEGAASALQEPRQKVILGPDALMLLIVWPVLMILPPW